jgi:two-component system response regulator NreC
MIRVLLVDDHAVFRSSLRVRLEQDEGITSVGEAGSAEQANARARVLEPDDVLIDLLLPRTSGYQAIPEILAVSPESRILVVSSQTGPTPVRQAISAGAHGYVPKRASDTELVDAIRRVAAALRPGAPGPPPARTRTHKPRDRREALHLGKNRRHAPRIHHAKAAAPDARR